jgi:hypothetical protein
MFLGFDRSDYPGDEVMQSLFDSVEDLTFVCLYLAPAPSHQDGSWMAAAPSLRSMGWGLLPTYVGQEVIGAGSHVVTAARGTADAQDSALLAARAGLTAGAVVYLDIENGGLMPGNQVNYVKAWVAEVTANTPYQAGVYCSSGQAPDGTRTAEQVASITADITAGAGAHPVFTWAFRPIDRGPSVIDLGTELPPDPATSGYGLALAWQYRLSMDGNIDIVWTDKQSGNRRRLNKVDLDAASVADPSFPDVDGPPDIKIQMPVRDAKLE